MEINIRRITKNQFSTTISKFIEIAIELNRWQFLVTVSHHQTVYKRTFKMPEGRSTLTEEEKIKTSFFCEEKHGVSFIANKIKRSRTRILNCMVRLNVPADLLNYKQLLHDDDFFERLPKENHALKIFNRNFT